MGLQFDLTFLLVDFCEDFTGKNLANLLEMQLLIIWNLTMVFDIAVLTAVCTRFFRWKDIEQRTLIGAICRKFSGLFHLSLVQALSGNVILLVRTLSEKLNAWNWFDTIALRLVGVVIVRDERKFDIVVRMLAIKPLSTYFNLVTSVLAQIMLTMTGNIFFFLLFKRFHYLLFICVEIDLCEIVLWLLTSVFKNCILSKWELEVLEMISLDS